MTGKTPLELDMDLMGTICPLPILEVNALMEHIPVNGIISVLVSDPATLTDFPAWARVTGQEILRVERNPGCIRFMIRKVK